MRTIWKYRLLAPRTRHHMKIGFKILHFAVQDGFPCIWVEVQTDNDVAPVEFIIKATGEPIDPTLTYAGTCFDHQYVLHLFY